MLDVDILDISLSIAVLLLLSDMMATLLTVGARVLYSTTSKFCVLFSSFQCLWIVVLQYYHTYGLRTSVFAFRVSWSSEFCTSQRSAYAQDSGAWTSNARVSGVSTCEACPMTETELNLSPSLDSSRRQHEKNFFDVVSFAPDKCIDAAVKRSPLRPKLPCFDGLL